MESMLEKLMGVRSQLADGLKDYFQALTELPNKYPAPYLGRRKVTEHYIKPYILRSEREKGAKSFAEERTGQLTDEESKGQRVSWEEERPNIQRGVILGRPGEGKTLLAQMTVRELALTSLDHLNAQTKDLDKLDIPVCVRLQDVVTLTLEEAVKKSVHEFLKPEQTKQVNALSERVVDRVVAHVCTALFTDRCWLFLDALDEAPDAESRLPKNLAHLQKANCHVVVTSRPYGYTPSALPFDPEVVKEYRLAPLEPSDQTAFVQSWFEVGDERASQVLKLVQDNPQFREMASNALLLTLTCATAEYHQLSPQTTQRVDLYDYIVRDIIRNIWKADQRLKEDDPHIEMMVLLLQHVATQLFLSAPENRDFPGVDWANAVIDAREKLGLRQGPEDILEELSMMGMVVAPSKNQRMFVHRSFQEYLTSCEIDRRERNSVQDSGVYIWASNLAMHFGESAWQEVTLFYAGKTANASELVKEILTRHENKLQDSVHWRFLRQILSEVRKLDKDTQELLLKRLNVRDPHEAARAAISLRSMSGATISTLDVKTLIEQFEANQKKECGFAGKLKYFLTQLRTRMFGINGDNNSLGRGHLALLLGEKGCVSEERRGEIIDVLKRNLGDHHVGYLCALGLDLLGYMGRHELDKYLMVEVPEGRFKMGGGREWPEAPYRVKTAGYLMARFALTNGEYGKFVKGGGYDDKQYWSEEGWKWKVRSGITEPGYWHDSRFNVLSAPVVGISWYEAETYGKWLSEKVCRNYVMPLEEKWARAARGDKDVREYPWGDVFDISRCNVANEAGEREPLIGQPTPVGSYPEGVSPYGCYEMAGNVWEWTRRETYREWTRRETYEEKKCVLRGGSWYHRPHYAHCSLRIPQGPVSDTYGDSIGVRFSRTL